VSVGIDGSNSMNADVNALQVRPERWQLPAPRNDESKPERFWGLL